MQQQKSAPPGETAVIVPFGKYRDRPVTDMLSDAGYVDWLQTQPWFREKYTAIFNVVNHIGAEPTDTPEHNKLQVQFLEVNNLYWAWPKLFSSFLAIMQQQWEADKKSIPDIETAEAEAAELSKEFNIIFRKEGNTRKCRDIEDAKSYLTEAISRVKHVKEFYSGINEKSSVINLAKKDILDGIHPALVISRYGVDQLFRYRAQFEVEGWDVWGEIRCKVTNSRKGFLMEIKPSVGDDFPSILRQMKNNKNRFHAARERGAYGQTDFFVLYTKQITALGATREQITKIFKAEGFGVIVDDDENFDMPLFPSQP